MLVEVNVKSIQQIDIDDTEAFKLLCKTLSMDIVLDEYTKFFVRQDSDGVNCVYEIINGHDECVDERGDLFVALRNVAVNMFPNLSFRSDDYIYR